MNKSNDTTLFLLFETQKLLKISLLEKLDKAGINLSIEQIILLNLLKEKGPQKQQFLADYLEKDKSTMVRLINSIEKKGMVVRGKSKEDTRLKLIKLTPRGENDIDKANQIIISFDKELSNDISNNKYLQLKSLLRNLLAKDSQESLF